MSLYIGFVFNMYHFQRVVVILPITVYNEHNLILLTNNAVSKGSISNIRGMIKKKIKAEANSWFIFIRKQLISML